MGRATPLKPAGAKDSFGLSKGKQQMVAGVLVIGVIVGLSHVFSPSDSQIDDVVLPSATAVTSLNDTTFDSFMASHPEGVLVDFFTKSCKFCTKLAPEFEKAAQKLHTSGGPALAMVDQDVGPKIMQKYAIDRFPTVLWLWKGAHVLEMARASEKPAAKITEWAQWAATPAIQDLETLAEFNGALETLRSTLHAKGRLMVAFNRAGSEGMRDAFEWAAQKNRLQTVFLYIKEVSQDGAVLKSYGGEEAKDEVYEGTENHDEVHQWVKGTLEKARPPAVKPSDATAKGLDAVEKALKNAEAEDEVELSDGKE